MWREREGPLSSRSSEQPKREGPPRPPSRGSFISLRCLSPVRLASSPMLPILPPVKPGKSYVLTLTVNTPTQSGSTGHLERVRMDRLVVQW